MTFNVAQFEAAVKQINVGLGRVDGLIAQIGPAAARAVNQPNVPHKVKKFVTDLADKAAQLGRAFVQKIVELLKGAVAPYVMFQEGQRWIDVRSQAARVQGVIEPTVLHVEERWKGLAADAYYRSSRNQSRAVSKVVGIAGEVATVLFVTAGAGLTFYVALGGIVAKFITAMAACVAALGTVVFSGAGLALAVGEMNVDFGLVFGAVFALTGVLAAEAHQLGTLRAQLGDLGAFPDGRWPASRSSAYVDASVLDGDADWSIKI